MSDDRFPDDAPTRPIHKSTGDDLTGAPSSGALRAAGARHRDDGKREWQHIRGTRIRTSTAALVVSFIVLFALYGYTSQRYGVVAPAQPVHHVNHTPRTSHTYEYSTTPSASHSSSSDTLESPSGTDEDQGTQGSEPMQAPVTTTQLTIPGLPGVSIPVPALPAPTTPTPTESTPER